MKLKASNSLSKRLKQLLYFSKQIIVALHMTLLLNMYCLTLFACDCDQFKTEQNKIKQTVIKKQQEMTTSTQHNLISLSSLSKIQLAVSFYYEDLAS